MFIDFGNRQLTGDRTKSSSSEDKWRGWTQMWGKWGLNRRQEIWSGGFIEKAPPHMLICMDAWFLGGCTIWGEVKGSLVGEALLQKYEGRLGEFIAPSYCVFSLFASWVWKAMWAVALWSCHHAFPSGCVFLTPNRLHSFKAVNYNKSFLPQAASVRVFYHNSNKVTKMWI